LIFINTGQDGIYLSMKDFSTSLLHQPGPIWESDEPYNNRKVPGPLLHSSQVKSKKAVSITSSECVLKALRIHNAMHMRHIVICCMSSSTIFFHIISWTVQFLEGKKIYWT
jgi:hypothetical protein